jgi:serine/threonine-protein kinase
MQTCPTCRTACDDAAETCPVDGTPLSGVDPLVGQVLGERYRLIARIGAGGMGTVYSAEHVVLRKRMAVKVLRPELSKDEDLVRRFQQEAIAASQIGQENIVDVTDFGRTPQGSIYYVMEELEGWTLAELLEMGPLPFERAIDLLVQVSRALGAAHGRGIVHRDLKPANVVVERREDGSDFVKVLDFGIAKSVGLPERGRVTRAGTLVGTPEYMAPEQGAATSVDHRADIYALGVLGYEMLTGNVPFSGDTAIATLLQHQTKKATPIRELRPEIPETLAVIVAKAMQKLPADRQQSMGEVVRELNGVRAELGLPSVHELLPEPAPAGGVAVAAPDGRRDERGSEPPRRRPTTARGATLELELGAQGRKTMERSRDAPSADAPRRGRIAVVAVLTVALVVAVLAVATWVRG